MGVFGRTESEPQVRGSGHRPSPVNTNLLLPTSPDPSSLRVYGPAKPGTLDR